MECREEGHAKTGQQGQMQPIRVGVDDIELGGPTSYAFEQSRLSSGGIRARTAKSQRSWPSRNKRRARLGIATCEQRHLMAELDQLFDEPRDDALGSAIELGGNTFGEGSK